MSKCVFAGSFDPFTNGHLSVVERAAVLFDKVIIAVADNASKNPVLDAGSRLALVKKAVTVKNAEVAVCSGLLIDFCRQNGADCIIKGVRNASDFDFENEMFKANLALGGIETVFLPSLPHISFVSSSFVKELVKLGKDVGAFVPEKIHGDIVSAYSKRKNQ